MIGHTSPERRPCTVPPGVAKRGPRWRSGRCLTLLVCVLVVAVLVTSTWAQARHRPAVVMRPGQAWLVSNEIHQMTLIDGTSAAVVAGVSILAPEGGLTSLQQGGSVVVTGLRSGSISLIDSASLRHTDHPWSGSGLLAGAGRIFGYGPPGGALLRIDGRTLNAVPVPGAVARTRGGPTLTQLMVGPDGRLWALDGTARPVPVSSTSQIDTAEPTPPSPRMLSAGREFAVADPEARVTWYGTDRSARSQATLPGRPGPATQFVADGATGAVDAFDPANGTLYFCRRGSAACGATQVPSFGARKQVGPLSMVRSHVLVPDPDHGVVWILDPPRSAPYARVIVGYRAFELVVQDDIVFFNQPDSAQAGVIDVDAGTVRHVRKYLSLPHTTTTRSPTPATITPSTTPTTTPPPTTPSSPSPTLSPTPPTTRPLTPNPARSGRSPSPTGTGGGPGRRNQKHKGGTATPGPSDYTPSGSITRPAEDTKVTSCSYFSGHSKLPKGKTLILASLNLSNGSSHQYVEFVFGWNADKPSSLASWQGAQWFNDGAIGQKFRITLIAVDLADARSADGDTTRRDALAGKGQVLARVNVQRISGYDYVSRNCTSK